MSDFQCLLTTEGFCPHLADTPDSEGRCHLLEGRCPPQLVEGQTSSFVFPTLKSHAIVISHLMFTAIFLIVKLREKWTYASPETQSWVFREKYECALWWMWRASKQRLFTQTNYNFSHHNKTSHEWYTEKMGVEKLNGLVKCQGLFLNERKISARLWNAVLY